MCHPLGLWMFVQVSIYILDSIGLQAAYYVIDASRPIIQNRQPNSTIAIGLARPTYVTRIGQACRLHKVVRTFGTQAYYLIGNLYCDCSRSSRAVNILIQLQGFMLVTSRNNNQFHANKNVKWCFRNRIISPVGNSIVPMISVQLKTLRQVIHNGFRLNTYRPQAYYM